MIPSTEALFLHWKRSCCVLHTWNQADKNTITLPDMEQFGWKITDNELTIVWDTEENIRNIQMRVDAILKGCKCTTARCGCRKKGSLCSEGCDCVNCKNMDQTLHTRQEDGMFEISLEEDMTTSNTMDKIQKHFQNVMLVGMASKISKNYTYKCVDRSRHNGIKGAKAKCAH